MKAALIFLAVLLATHGAVPCAKTRAELISEVHAVLQKATETANKIPDDPGSSLGDRAGYLDPFMGADRQMEVVARIGQIKAEAGDVQGALEIVKRVTENEGEPILWRVAVAQAQAGDASAALKTAEGLTSDKYRILALAHIGVEQTESGDLVGANATFSRALEIAKAQEGSTVEQGMTELLKLIRVGAPAGSVKALAIADPAGRLPRHLLVDLAELELANSNLKNALPILNMVKDDPSALGEFAVAQAKQGDFTGALATASTVTAEVPKEVALSGIASAQAASGDVRHALETVAMIKGEDSATWRARALAAIAKSEAMAGNRVEAQREFAEAVQEIKASKDASPPTGLHDARGRSPGVTSMAFFRATELARIAQTQAEARETAGSASTFREAVQIARTVPPGPAPYVYFPYGQEMAFRMIAQAQAEAGDASGALQTANMIKVKPEAVRGYAGGNPKVEAFWEIATAEGRTGNSQEALAWIAKQASPLEKSWALVGLAEGLMSQALTTDHRGTAVTTSN